MENFLRAYLPEEIVMSILYKHKAIQTPTAELMSKHFKRCEIMLDSCWEEWNYPERPEIGDVDAMNMLDMIVGISQGYEEWLENGKEADRMKMEDAKFKGETKYTTYERSFLNYDRWRNSGGYGMGLRMIEVDVEETDDEEKDEILDALLEEIE